jgi:hypothetical protein
VVQAIDQAGNSSVPVSYRWTVDTTPPTASPTYTGATGTNGWYKTIGKVNLAPADVASGVDFTTYSLDGGEAQVYTNPFPLGGDREHKITYTVVDVAGNSLTGTYTFNLDTVAPTVVAPNYTTHPGDSTGAFVSFSAASASDGTSGLLSLVFNPAFGSHFLVGTTTVGYTATDCAGNVATGTFTVTVNPAGMVDSQLWVVGAATTKQIVVDSTNKAATSVTIDGFSAPGSPFNLSGITKPILVYGNGGGGANITIRGSFETEVYGCTIDVSEFTGKGKLTGGGNSTVIATRNADFVLTDTQLKIGTQILTLSGMGIANLTGGTRNNTFDVSGWTGGGSLTGRGVTNTVVFDKDVIELNLANNLLSSSNGMRLSLSAISKATLTGGVGANTFNLTGWTGLGTFAGGAGSDTLNYQRDANFTLTSTSLTITPVTGTARTWTLRDFETANLTAGAGNSTFTVTGWTGGGSLTGGTGNNTFNVTGWAGTGSLTGGGGSDTVVVTRDTNFALTDSQLKIGAQILTLFGIGTANLTGGTGNNTFNLTGWTGLGIFAGGTGSDTLNYQRDANFTLTSTSLAITLVSGTVSTWPLKDFEKANLTAGAGNNTFTVTGWTGGGSLTGGGGSDTVVVTRDANPKFSLPFTH